MTTEKEFWEFTSRYFRTVVSIQNIIDELKVSGGLSKDVRAIKAMKGVENIMKEFDEQNQKQSSIDEECVGCAGPCKVVDVAAKLQKELDSAIGQLVDSRKRCDHLSTQIEYLQNELGSAQNMYLASSDECSKQRKIIGDYRETIQLERIDYATTLKTVNQYHHAKIKDLQRKNATIEGLEVELFDLKNAVPDNFWAVVTEKDSMIRRQGKVIEDFKTTIDDLESKLSEKPDTVGMLNYTTNIENVILKSQADDNTINDLLSVLSITKEAVVDRNRTIEDLKDRNIEDLHELYDLYEDELRDIKADRTSIKSDRDIMFQNYQNTVAKLQGNIRGLEAELSTRKKDSEVLKKVVDGESFGYQTLHHCFLILHHRYLLCWGDLNGRD